MKCLNSNALKIVAIIAMTIDHLAWLIFPIYDTSFLPVLMHIIGRITCPIMCFFIAEGYYHTKNLKKYILRLFIFALISHVPYMLQSTNFKEYGWLSLIPFATGNGINRFLNQTSVIFSLLIGLLMLDVANKNIKYIYKIFLILLLCLLAFPCDWSCIASLIILSIGTNRGKPLKQILFSLFYISIYVVVYYFSINKVYGLIQYGVILSIPLLMLYNGKRGKKSKFMKWIFYIYYPLHLLILGLIGLF